MFVEVNYGVAISKQVTEISDIERSILGYGISLGENTNTRSSGDD
jgi:hypothetical protein